MSEALHTDMVDWMRMLGCMKPNLWETGRASFFPKANSTAIETHRPILPSEPTQGVASRAVLLEKTSALQPQKLCAVGAAQGGSAGAHILTAQLIAKKASEEGDPDWWDEGGLVASRGHCRAILGFGR